MDKFELWQVSSFHFWPRWWVLERAGLLRGNPSCSDGISTVIELGWKGNLFFFFLVFVKEVSGGIAEEQHQNLRLYTLDVLTELKKASIDYDKDISTLLNHTAPAWAGSFLLVML